MDYTKLTVQDLPESFQKRIARFNRLFSEHTEDHHDFEHDDLFTYELFCLQQAKAYLDTVPTKEEFNKYVEECKRAWAEADHEKYSWETEEAFKDRIAKGPTIEALLDYIKTQKPELWISQDHSGNTFGFSWQVFRAQLQNPEYVPYLHGALAPLTGDEGYYDDRSDIPEF